MYREIAALQPLQEVSLCSMQTWENFEGGIYFEDGTLMQGGHMPKATRIDIPECYRVVSWQMPSSSRTYACHVLARPIFNCDPGNSSSCPTPRACAWAITGVEEEEFSSSKEGDPLVAPTAPDCGTSGLCGMVFNFRFFMNHLGRNPEAMDTLRSALETASAQLPGNLNGASPLGHAGKPNKI
ncbi:unnamed protein product [Symbiodinium sp. CCMP2456]|nr:unnamed protein product [Symbiodinium sp. CCMP2456]